MHVRRGALFASLLLLARFAAADQERPFRLKYDAPTNCPASDVVTARILASASRARLAVGEESHYDVTLSITQNESGFRASLSVRLPDGSETARTVPAPSCAEAVDAAALIAAITIDPEALAAEAARRDAETKAAAAPPVEETKPAEPPLPKPAEQLKPDVREQKHTAERPPELDRSPSGGFEGRLLFDAGAGLVALAIAPGLAPDFFAGLAYEPRLAGAQPRFGLSLHFAQSFAVAAQEGEAKFRRTAGRLHACPFRFGVPDVNLRPCASFELGFFSAEGTGQLTSLDVSPFVWTAAGAFLSGEIRASDRWGARIDLGAVFPFRRDEFYFDPNRHIVHQIPPVGLFAALALELSIL